MCGIVGYIGDKQVAPILIDGLKKLEYRGYDSAGVAVMTKDGIRVQKTKGKIVQLEQLLKTSPLSGTMGIGHTRWATHGAPSDKNSHPHSAGKVTVVHNGIIENYLELRLGLEKKGRRFLSETDTEVIAHVIDEEFQKGLAPEKAIREGIKKLQGALAVVIMIEGIKDTLFTYRKQSPLIVGYGEGENLVASDIPAVLAHTRTIVPFEDGDFSIITRDKVVIKDAAGKELKRKPIVISWTAEMAEKGGYKHFMLKEIFEQPKAVADTLSGRCFPEQGKVKFDELPKDIIEFIKHAKKIQITACGTAFHAGLTGKYLIEQLARIPCMCEIASELRYRRPLIDKETLLIAISQSGETADTLAAEEEARKLGAKSIAICNVVGSSLSRHANGTLYTRAGPEIGVASTKAFITQVTVLCLLAVYLAELRKTLTKSERAKLLKELAEAPRLIEEILKDAPKIEQIARNHLQSKIFFFIARGVNYPIALEGALKLKEISYVHAEGYPAGELKHGPIAILDKNASIVALAPSNRLFEKTFSNIEEVAARMAHVISVGNADQAELLKKRSEDIIFVPKMREELDPLVITPPLQLLAYYVADLNGTDVDQPRNLAKSVTVE
jgi:glucosamine--fructose-6-phosphate aminotransferase (isomerizing)